MLSLFLARTNRCTVSWVASYLRYSWRSHDVTAVIWFLYSWQKWSALFQASITCRSYLSISLPASNHPRYTCYPSGIRIQAQTPHILCLRVWTQSASSGLPTEILLLCHIVKKNRKLILIWGVLRYSVSLRNYSPSYSSMCVCVYSPFMMTSSDGNIFRVTGPLLGEFTGHRWIPLTKAGDTELSLICAWIYGWVNKREGRHRAHCNVKILMLCVTVSVTLCIRTHVNEAGVKGRHK